MKKTHLIQRLFTVLIPALVFGLIPLHGQVAPTVREANGIVAVEAERATAHGGWVTQTTIAGYSGSAYHYMGGTDSFNSPGNALLEYPVVISTAGAYQLQLRSRIAYGTLNTEHNDTFARLVSENGTAVAPIANSNTAHGTHWYKIYVNDLNVWTWNSSNRDHDPKSLAWNLTAGTYRIQLSKRSMGHAVDRIVLWNRALHNLASTSTGKSANSTALNNLINSSDVASVTPDFDRENDLFIAQFDGRPDADDIHAQAAIGSLLQHPEFDDINHVYAVHNAYGKQTGVIHDSKTLMAMIFGGAEGADTWTDANTTNLADRTNPASKWVISVNRVANKAQAILAAGGAVWVMEAGQSDFTAYWVAELISRGVSESVIKQNVYIVQHSTWNENETSAGFLDYVKLKTTYVKISDGNHKNDTPDYETDDDELTAQSVLRTNAKSPANPNATTRALWTEADRIIGSWSASYSCIHLGGLDFSDASEAWWIFELEDAFTIPAFWNKYVVSANTQIPFHGSPHAIPGTVQAEDYDWGGPGVAYHDTTTGNSGGIYRSDDVDVVTTADGISGKKVGYTVAGEWLEYTVDVAASGTYDIDLRVASQSAVGTLHILFDGINKTGTIQFPTTGGWETWTTVRVSGVSLQAGEQVMRIAIDSSNWDLNYVTFTQSAGYNIWAGGTFANDFNDTDPESDPDGDGFINLQEFAFGMDPTLGTLGSLDYEPNGNVTKTGSPILLDDSVEPGKFHAVYGRRKDYQATGLIYTCEFSADLVLWTASATAPTVLTSNSSESDIEAVSVPYPVSVPLQAGGSQPPKFFRVALVSN